MEMEMEVQMEMDVDVVAIGRKRSAASEDAAGLEEERRREEELRGKAPKWNSVENESREDFSPEIRELLHKGNKLKIRNAATHARSARFRAELARLCPKAGIPK